MGYGQLQALTYFWPRGVGGASQVLVYLVLFPHRSQAMQLRLASSLSSSCFSLLNAGQVVGFPHCLNEWPFLVSNNRCLLELVSRKKRGLQSGHKQTVVWPWLKPFQTSRSLFLKPVKNEAATPTIPPVPASAAVRIPSRVPKVAAHLLFWKH